MLGETTKAAKPTVGNVQHNNLVHLKDLSRERLSIDAMMPVTQSANSAA